MFEHHNLSLWGEVEETKASKNVIQFTIQPDESTEFKGTENEAHGILEAIESLMAQHKEEFEALIRFEQASLNLSLVKDEFDALPKEDRFKDIELTVSMSDYAEDKRIWLQRVFTARKQYAYDLTEESSREDSGLSHRIWYMMNEYKDKRDDT